MAISESETRYPETTGFIYRECARRLKERKLSLKMTDAEIAADGFDRKVVNRVLNGTRTRNNPYLIPPAYIKPLVEKLRFSEVELFWGDINSQGFIETLFCNLVTDILDESDWNENYFDGSCWSKSEAKIEIIQKVLLDSVAYARIYPTLNSSYEYENPEGVYYPISPYADVSGGEQVTPAERKQIRQGAILRLFKNTRPVDMLKAFFRETNNRGENRGFRRLDKRLDGFVEASLMPFMQKNNPGEDSLGIRVFSIVSADMARYVETGLMNAQRTAVGFGSSTSSVHDEILESLMVSGRDYISRIEGLQVRLDALHQNEKFGH